MNFWKNLICDVIGMCCVFMFPLLILLFAVGFGVPY